MDTARKHRATTSSCNRTKTILKNYLVQSIATISRSSLEIILKKTFRARNDFWMEGILLFVDVRFLLKPLNFSCLSKIHSWAHPRKFRGTLFVNTPAPTESNCRFFSAIFVFLQCPFFVSRWGWKPKYNNKKGTRPEDPTSKQSSLVFCRRKRQNTHTHIKHTNFTKKKQTPQKNKKKLNWNKLNQNYTKKH